MSEKKHENRYEDYNQEEHEKNHNDNNNKNHKGHNHSNHHEMMIQDFKRRFFISLIVTIPILILSPLTAGVLYGIGIVISPAVGAVLMSLSTIIVAINAKLLKVE